MLHNKLFQRDGYAAAEFSRYVLREHQMNIPEVYEGDWIKVGSIDALVIRASKPGKANVGYFQNESKPIGEDVFWTGETWEFKYKGPNGAYLSGALAAAVKRGPRDN